MNLVIISVVVIVILVVGLAVVHKKHHGNGGCIRNCEKCPHPCHHKGRF